jgi:hypothetical protein
MTTVQFAPASKRAGKLRMAIDGPAGSGKTYTALSIASALATPVALVDTEHGSASKYADIFDFAVLELDSFHPERYMEAIGAAEAGGFGTLILDSLSHAWSGKDGVLELVDRAAKRSNSGNSFTAWKDVTPTQNALIERILASKLHIIVTLRVKTEYVIQTNEKGRQEPKKVGLAPVQRDQLEYEFDVYGRLDNDNTMVITKTRCPALAGGVIPRPGAELAHTLSDWLSGAPPEPEMVRSADNRVWKRWLEVLAEAQGLNAQAKEIRLPIALDELKAHANTVLAAIAERKALLATQQNGVAKRGDPTPEAEQALSEALSHNANLLDEARELQAMSGGVQKLDKLKASVDWPLERIEKVNAELEAALKARNASLDAIAAQQSAASR